MEYRYQFQIILTRKERVSRSKLLDYVGVLLGCACWPSVPKGLSFLLENIYLYAHSPFTVQDIVQHAHCVRLAELKYFMVKVSISSHLPLIWQHNSTLVLDHLCMHPLPPFEAFSILPPYDAPTAMNMCNSHSLHAKKCQRKIMFSLYIAVV